MSLNFNAFCMVKDKARAWLAVKAEMPGSRKACFGIWGRVRVSASYAPAAQGHINYNHLGIEASILRSRYCRWPGPGGNRETAKL